MPLLLLLLFLLLLKMAVCDGEGGWRVLDGGWCAVGLWAVGGGGAGVIAGSESSWGSLVHLASSTVLFDLRLHFLFMSLL